MSGGGRVCASVCVIQRERERNRDKEGKRKRDREIAIKTLLSFLTTRKDAVFSPDNITLAVEILIVSAPSPPVPTMSNSFPIDYTSQRGLLNNKISECEI